MADGSTHDRLRASNRRHGISNSQELFIGERLSTTWSYDSKQAEERFLTIERFRGDVRLLTETVAIYKSVCVREADDQWCIVTEYGRKDVVVLEGLADRDVRRFAAKFGITLTSRNAGGAPEKVVSRRREGLVAGIGSKRSVATRSLSVYIISTAAHRRRLYHCP